MKSLIVVFVLWFSGMYSQKLTLSQANHLASLPLKCLQQEYPNKLNQLLKDSSELAGPKQLHPSFYGCFDWHSAVHGHWSLVFLINQFPDLSNKSLIVDKLKTNLSKQNIESELVYFSKKHEKSFERTYGWAWLLKLQQELEKSKMVELNTLSLNLKPLTDTLVERYIEFLPKLLYPVRVGTHNNTAFGLVLAWDYAVHAKNQNLQNVIEANAKRLFLEDKNFSFDWEPSGTDFLSPGLEEIAIMQRILPEIEFLKWLKIFNKFIFSKKFKLEVARVSDRTDGHLVHLDGLNFSRAWNLNFLANQFPKQFNHLKKIAETHLNFSMPTIVDGNYEGEHWLASFALHCYE